MSSIVALSEMPTATAAKRRGDTILPFPKQPGLTNVVPSSKPSSKPPKQLDEDKGCERQERLTV